jgi:mono/diheme cytochrome c family protein
MKKYLFFILLPFLSCKPAPPPVAGPVAAEPANPGREVYMKHCLACHQTNGSGVPGMFPPLLSTDWIKGDSERLIGLLLFGQEGEITVNGKLYKGVMPPHAFLTDVEIADVLTFIRANFGNESGSVTPEEVSRIRAKGKTN